MVRENKLSIWSLLTPCFAHFGQFPPSQSKPPICKVIYLVVCTFVNTCLLSFPRQNIPDQALAAFRHEVEQQADFRVLEFLVGIDSGKLHGCRRRLRQYHLQPAVPDIGLDLEARLVDDAPPCQRPTGQHIAIV